MKKYTSVTLSFIACLLLSSCDTPAVTQAKKPSEKTAEAEPESISVVIETEAEKAVTDSTPSAPAAVDTEDKAENSSFSLNDDLISELGQTYVQLCEKYGDTPKALYNTCGFKDGYGVYGWKSSDGTVFENIDEAGGCNVIDGISTDELFGSCGSATFDDLADIYGLVLVSAANDQSDMDFKFWAEFTHPSYSDVSFVLATDEYGVVDTGTSISLILNKDCLEASPVI